MMDIDPVSSDFLLICLLLSCFDWKQSELWTVWPKSKCSFRCCKILLGVHHSQTYSLYGVKKPEIMYYKENAFFLFCASIFVSLCVFMHLDYFTSNILSLLLLFCFITSLNFLIKSGKSVVEPSNDNADQMDVDWVSSDFLAVLLTIEYF